MGDRFIGPMGDRLILDVSAPAAECREEGMDGDELSFIPMDRQLWSPST